MGFNQDRLKKKYAEIDDQFEKSGDTGSLLTFIRNRMAKQKAKEEEFKTSGLEDQAIRNAPADALSFMKLPAAFSPSEEDKELNQLLMTRSGNMPNDQLASNNSMLMGVDPSKSLDIGPVRDPKEQKQKYAETAKKALVASNKIQAPQQQSAVNAPAPEQVDQGDSDYRRNLLGLGLAEAAGKIGSSIAGSKQDTGLLDKMRSQVETTESRRLAKIKKDQDKKWKEDQVKADRIFKKSLVRMKLAQKNPALALSPGQKKMDTKFGEDYATYKSMGGKSEADKQLGLLDEAINALEKGGAQTGKAFGLAESTGLSSYIMPDSQSNLEKLKIIVAPLLRQTMGAAFTAAEGELVFSLNYNPKLPSATNVEKMRKLRKEIQARSDAKHFYGKYFDKAGTLKGAPSLQAPEPQQQMMAGGNMEQEAQQEAQSDPGKIERAKIAAANGDVNAANFLRLNGISFEQMANTGR